MKTNADINVEVTRREAWKLFDRIAQRYDFLNRFLSFGQDVLWRKKMALYLPKKTEISLLDLATGTADQLLFLFEKTDSIAQAVGVDLSDNMLAIGKKKIDDRKLDQKITLKPADGAALPFPENTFDCTTIAFGIRNIPDYQKSLREMLRVLKPGGISLVLEFSLPHSPLVRWPYLFYFRYILPFLGGWISGDSSAYRYLNATVEQFPHGDGFLQMMSDAGFKKVRRIPLSFGIATIYVGEKSL